MRFPADLAPLQEPLAAVCRLLKLVRHPGMIIGGMAVALLARPRHTADIDAVVWCPDASDADEILAAARRLSFEPRLDEVFEFAQSARVLLLRHVPSGIEVDISLAQLDYEHQAVKHHTKVRAGRLEIPVATVEDLIVMKAVANRPQDLIDIANLVESNSKLDREYVLKWLAAFAALLDEPQLVENIRRVLGTPKRPRRRKP